MAASFTSQLSLLSVQDRSSGLTSSSGLAPMTLKLGGSSRQSGSVAFAQGLGYKRGSLHVVAARRPSKNKDGALAEAVKEVKTEENSEADKMWMGKKLEGLEPDFWEGEQWDIFGFIVQYLWAFGILIAVSFPDVKKSFCLCCAQLN
jgi:hypothetical protein